MATSYIRGTLSEMPIQSLIVKHPSMGAKVGEMKFHYLARAVIVNKNRILIVKDKTESHTFLPGGHIENCEAAKDALRREIFEELGLDCNIGEFIGASEHVWPLNTSDKHELNLVFLVQVNDIEINKNPESKESHIEFIWSSFDELDRYNLSPENLKENIIQYFEKKKSFFGELK